MTSLTNNLINDSLAIASKNFWKFLGYGLITIIISAIIGGLLQDSEYLSSIVNNIVSCFLTVGFLSFVISTSLETKETGIEGKEFDYFLGFKGDNFKVALNLFIGNIAYGIIVFIGLLLLIIPGIYLMNRLMFWSFYVVDEKMNFIDAMSKSFNLTEGEVLNLIGLQIKLIGLNILGMLALFIGLLWTIPASAVAVSKTWFDLKEKKNQNSISSEIPNNA